MPLSVTRAPSAVLRARRVSTPATLPGRGVAAVARENTPVAEDAHASSAELLERAAADYGHQQEITARDAEEQR